ALMNNASSITKAMDQLSVEHIGCTVHTKKLALGDRFDVTKVSNLINKAKTLNSYVSSKHKYYESFYKLQAELNLQYQVNSLSNLLLSIEEWNSIDELAKLLYPFAQATGYIEESQYFNLEIIISTLIKLLHHLKEFYSTITLQTVKACCSKIN
ncbi:13878_t:CDS:2, partial [Cetraspora pellucida]